MGLTRAKEKVYLTAAQFYEGVQKKKISRFVLETMDDTKNLIFPDAQKSTTNIMALETKANLNKPKSVYELPTSFSFSQLRSFTNCPYQYKMLYLVKLPAPGSHYFSFGYSIHLTLQRFYGRVQELNTAQQTSLFAEVAPKSTGIKIPELKELIEIYEVAWNSDWYQNKRQREEYFARGKEMLKQFYTQNENVWTIPLVLEGGFTIPIGEWKVTGKIDRLDQLKSGGLQIIDYKTGQPKEKLTHEDKEQLLLYQLAASQDIAYRHYGVVEKLTYCYLENNTQMDFVGSDKDLEELKTELHETITKIYATDFNFITRANACGRCEFCKVSEFRS